AYHNMSLWIWSVSLVIGLLLLSFLVYISLTSLIIYWAIALLLLLILNVRPLRCILLSKPLFYGFRKAMPALSKTEQEALAAGAVGWEGELFSGKPDWKKCLSIPSPHLSIEEQAFLEGPVNQLCAMVDDWDITHKRVDLPPEMWDFIKKERFWAMIIPKEYGGLGFSAYAQVAILTRINGCSVTVATTVMVPNSLGPAELLLKYGETAQKEYYLPRLAIGEEIPCFALTGPTAGSDAASIPDSGIVCHGEFEGKNIIGLRLNWDKRYITLAPVATVLGLAFQCFDPEHLLSRETERGITCALIPTNMPGIRIGRRHFPLNSPFMNGPTQGKDVFIPLDWIIGGEKMIGRGWQMLMACLGAGRALSLPSGANAGAQVAALATGAYARIRQQFSLPIGFFEGVEEALAIIAGNTYIIDAAVRLAATTIDHGTKSAITSAIVKQQTTERARQIGLAAMDIHGGKGICLGPRNYLARGYQAMPISITVEGANILTRSFIIFGQGVIRCHPYMMTEMESIASNDVARFDRAFFAHIGYMISRKVRLFFLNLTRAHFISVPDRSLKRYFQKVTLYSSALAFTAELAIVGLRGDLKRREKLSGRFADIMGSLYLISAVLKRFIDDGKPKEHRALVDWACQHLFYTIEQRLLAIRRNFPVRLFALSMRLLSFPWGKRCKPPSDKLSHQLAKLLITPSVARDKLTASVYRQSPETNFVAMMEQALPKIIAVEPLEKRLKAAKRAGKISGLTLAEQTKAALQAGLITEDEAKQLQLADTLRMAVIAVDDFSSEELKSS
ncbi:MAG: acyl-CoA dehydrogenase, partial [Gammaproteobacteria bacterium]